MWVSVDPSLRCTGVALWDASGTLHSAFCIKTKSGRGVETWSTIARQLATEAYTRFGEMPTGYAVETMKVYTAGKRGNARKADLNDLLEVNGVAGAVAGHFTSYGVPGKNVVPSDWKRQLPKNVVINRVKTRLSHAEHERVEGRQYKYSHNAYEAVGIGLYFLNRWSYGYRSSLPWTGRSGSSGICAHA